MKKNSEVRIQESESRRDARILAYVETNFVLELVFEQEQCVSCEQILQSCEIGQAKLIIPAYSLAEPHEKLSRQAKSRRDLQQLLDAELRQLSRTVSYINRKLLIDSIFPKA
ncbi:hypothetical protein [Nostoc sp.]|uniref:hypothetical protein n=1 Tax=Nostoc sp. TaxID=1180 RepID=UPI002FFB22C1